MLRLDAEKIREGGIEWQRFKEFIDAEIESSGYKGKEKQTRAIQWIALQIFYTYKLNERNR